MNRLSSYVVAIAGAIALCAPVSAQSSDVTSLTVSSEPAGSRFMVDGLEYTTAVTFQWQIGSKHILQWIPNQPDNSQLDQTGKYKYTFGGWEESTGLLSPSAYQNQTVIADPTVKWYKANISTTFLVEFIMFFGKALPSDTQSPPACAVPGDVPPGMVRPGVVYINGTCYWSNVSMWMTPTEIGLNAFPYPGYLFQGWSVQTGPPNSFMTTVKVTGPTTFFGYWNYGKRTKFTTSPAGLNVTVDNQVFPTPPQLPCDVDHLLPPTVEFVGGSVPTTLCVGQFDFALDSKHTLNAPAPQRDAAGNLWALDTWVLSGGTGRIDGNVYTASSNQWITPDNILAKFGPAVSATFITQPASAKVTVDGRDDWASNTFYWAQGQTHTASAPIDVTDATGRKYKFIEWNNGGSATQSIKFDKSMTLVANYEKLQRAVVQATSPKVVFSVDGSDCPTPCTLDRSAGTTALVIPPASIPLTPVSRLELFGWQDGGSGPRTVSFNQDLQAVNANYILANKVTVISDPVGAANVDMSPASADGFYRADAQVALIANAKPGYKFLHWEGDSYSTDHIITVTTKSPRIMRAIFAKAPVISPAGVRNAASDTPVTGVAPGSLISIYGANLANQLEAGPASPLAQSLAGTMVMLGDRLLPLIYVSPDQINAQLPDDIEPGTYKLTVRTDGMPDVTADFTAVRNAPGLFINEVEGKQYALAIHEDGSLITPASPAKRTELVTVLGTGFGPYKQRALEGFAATETPVNPLVDAVEVTANGAKLQTSSAVAATGYVGISAVKFRLTKELPTGNVDLKMTSNGQPTNTLPLPVE